MGQYTIYAPLLKDNQNNAANYIFDVEPNMPYLPNCKAYLDKTSITASESLEMIVEVRDAFLNPIPAAKAA